MPTGLDPTVCAAGSTAKVLPRGDSLVVTYESQTAAVACIDVVAGEVIDLAVATKTGFFANPTLVSDGASPARPPLPMTALPQRVFGAMNIPNIYPAVTAPATGRYLLYLVPSDCSRCTNDMYEGTATLHFRNSGPVLLAQFRGSPLTSDQTFQFRMAPGTTTLDTILLRNVGAGSVTVTVSGRAGLASPVNATVTASGPSAGWDVAQGAVAAAVQVSATSVPGFHHDTLMLTGIPDDIWNVIPYREIPVGTRVHEAEYVSLPSSFGGDFVVRADGDIVIKSGFPTTTFYRGDRPSGQLVPWRTTDVTANLTFIEYANGQVYFRGEPDNTLYRIGESGPAEALFTGASERFLPLPDGSVFDLGGSLVRHRSAAGAMDTLFWAQGLSKSAVFNQADSVLYYTRESGLLVEIRKIPAAVGTSPIVATVNGLSLGGADSYGRLYAIENQGSSGSLGNNLVVLSATGVVLDRRYPIYRAEKIRVARDSIFGFASLGVPGPQSYSPAFWVIPVRPPAP